MSRRLKAEMWDKMQYLFRNFYDRMIHTQLIYEGKIDENAFRAALSYMIDNSPVLHSSFHTRFFRPFWRIEKYTLDDILTVTDSDDIESDTMSFLTGETIPVSGNVQIKVVLVRGRNKTGIAVLVNHMCMDGGDCKYFLASLCENYNRLVGENCGSLAIKTGSRSYDTVYSSFSSAQRRRARLLLSNVSAAGNVSSFPWADDDGTESTRIIRHVIDTPDFQQMKQACKKSGVTVNDAVLALMIRSLYEVSGRDEQQDMTVQCMVDLRKHMSDGGQGTGLTNHTGFMTCRVENKGITFRDTLRMVADISGRNKNDLYMGLHGLPLLHLVYSLLPHKMAEALIKTGYRNPPLAMSNIGILDARRMTFSGTALVDGFMTGATKYKPYMLLSLTTLNDKVTFAVAERGNERDEAMVKRFFSCFEMNLQELLCSGAAERDVMIAYVPAAASLATAAI